MDGARFDTITRRLAAGVSRRTALKGVATGLLAALGLRDGADAQVSRAQCGNKTCKNNPARCDDGCVCCVYSNGNSRCRPPGTCAPGIATCAEGEIVDPILGCVPAECATASDCGADDPCVGYACEAGLCRSTELLPKGSPCGVGQACVDGACRGRGGCTGSSQCQAGFGFCGGDEVCTGTVCVASVEGAFVCGDTNGLANTPCSGESSGECGPGRLCVTGFCGGPVCTTVCV